MVLSFIHLEYLYSNTDILPGPVEVDRVWRLGTRNMILLGTGGFLRLIGHLDIVEVVLANGVEGVVI